MIHDTYLWGLACDMARSGEYANVIMIERELRSRGLVLGGHLTSNVVRRELLTRVCHAVRNGHIGDPEEMDDPLPPATLPGFRPGPVKAPAH